MFEILPMKVGNVSTVKNTTTTLSPWLAEKEITKELIISAKLACLVYSITHDTG